MNLLSEEQFEKLAEKLLEEIKSTKQRITISCRSFLTSRLSAHIAQISFGASTLSKDSSAPVAKSLFTSDATSTSISTAREEVTGQSKLH